MTSTRSNLIKASRGRKRDTVSTLIIIMTMISLVAWSPCFSAQKPFQGMKLVVPLQALPSTTFLSEHIGELERETGMKVQIQLLPEVELWDKLAADCATGAGSYDVLNLEFMYVPEFAEAGWIVPLNKYITSDYEVEDIIPKFRETGMHKGIDYAFPIYGEGGALWCRKDLLENAGLQPPDTFYDLMEAARTLTNPPDHYGIGTRSQRGGTMNILMWTGFLRGFGGKYFDETWHPVFNSPEGVYATEFYRDIIQRYGPPGGTSYSWDDVILGLTSGKIAMINSTTDIVEWVFNPEKSVVHDKLVVALVPRGPAGRYPEIFTSQLAISAVGAKTEKERKAAWAFIAWATGKDMTEKQTFEGYIPTPNRQFVFKDPRFGRMYSDEKRPGWLRTVVETFEIQEPEYRPRIEEWREIGDRLGIEVELAIGGQKSAKKALDAAAEFVEKVLRRSGRIK